jgi:hypothetical protein
LSSPAAVTRSLLLLAMHLPIKRNLEANAATIIRLVLDRMCHTKPPGEEGINVAVMLLPAIARLGSRSPEAHAVVRKEVKQRLNHELQVAAQAVSRDVCSTLHRSYSTTPPCACSTTSPLPQP